MILRIDPPIPLITTKGKAYAHFLVDYAIDDDFFWVCFMDDSGECWTFRNKEVRARKNVTLGRENISPFYDPNDVAFVKGDIEI
jgi:hypothetical protein